MELEGRGEITQIKQRGDSNPQDRRGMEAAITVDMRDTGCLTLFCKLDEAAQFRLGQQVRLALTSEEITQSPAAASSGRKGKRSTDSSST